MSRYGGQPTSGNTPSLVVVSDAKRRDTLPKTGWRIPYGWLLILGEYRSLGGAKHFRDLSPELTIEGARRVMHEEIDANPRIHWAILRCKDFDSYVDRWYNRRPRRERDEDLLPERVRLDAELEDDDR